MVAEARTAAFIDRDGVINVELDYLNRIEDFHVLPSVVEGLRALAETGIGAPEDYFRICAAHGG